MVGNKFKLIIIAFLLSFCSCLVSKGYNSSVKQVRYIVSDSLGNVYLIEKNQIKKMNANLQQLALYSHKNSGNISQVDAKFPLRLLLFFKEQQSILTLDNTLSEHSYVDLSEKFTWIDLVAYSNNDNKIWVYSNVVKKLYLIDKSLKILREVNINLLVEKDVNPTILLEKDNILYLYDSKIGFLLFDIYGTYIKVIQLENVVDFQVKDDNIYFLKNNIIQKYNKLNFETDSIYQGKNKLYDFSIIDNQLFVLDSLGIVKSSFTNK